MPQGIVPGRPCAKMSALLGTRSWRLSFARSIFATYPSWSIASFVGLAFGGTRGARASRRASSRASGGIGADEDSVDRSRLVPGSSKRPVPSFSSFSLSLSRARLLFSCTAFSMAPRSGSSTVAYTSSASAMAGAAASTNGSRHPNAGPTVPAMICPSAMPAPVATVRNVATYARSFVWNKSPHMLNSKGKQPPTATPVSARAAKSCQ
mmetsp:Transcript_6298/g.26764  ORF Transcript_6298/g.26764 Transcript_6298/m.26764 type:complete len:208 (-) Transcript_6298:572-1195(-)